MEGRNFIGPQPIMNLLNKDIPFFKTNKTKKCEWDLDS